MTFIQIKRLIQKFITKQETINLVVVPCNVDIATTEALKMAQEVDPSGERTLGVSVLYINTVDIIFSSSLTLPHELEWACVCDSNRHPNKAWPGG